MHLTVYADESYDPDVYCCGSFFGWPRTFYYLGLDWENRLKKDGLTHFSASDCEGLEGEFSSQRPRGYGLDQARARASSVRHDLTQIIQGESIVGVSMSIVRKDFEVLVDENVKAKKYFGTDILIANYTLLIKAVIELMEKDWPEQKYSRLKIAFLLDEHSNWKAAEEAYEQIKSENAVYTRRMAVVDHADDKEYPGLQMADLMAHEARLKTKEWVRMSETERHTLNTLKQSHNI